MNCPICTSVALQTIITPETAIILPENFILEHITIENYALAGVHKFLNFAGNQLAIILLDFIHVSRAAVMFYTIINSQRRKLNMLYNCSQHEALRHDSKASKVYCITWHNMELALKH